MQKEGSVLNDLHSLPGNPTKEQGRVHIEVRTDCFDYFTLDNRTSRWNAKLVLFQGIDDAPGNPPAGFVRDTGVIVGGVDVGPGRASTTVVPVKCEANRIRWSIHWKHQVTGREETENYPDLVAEQGKYWAHNVQTFKDAGTRDPDDLPALAFPIRGDLNSTADKASK
jgi:hypothetical protein